MDFRLSNYASFLTNLMASGYECLPFSDPHARFTEGRNLLLRHDVDMDPVAAIPMAETEAKIGARSTFFILLSNRHTNPFDKSFRDAIQCIHDLGHWIGLHFDATQYDLASDSPMFAEFVTRESQVLETLSDAIVDSVSFHRPSRDLICSSQELTEPFSHTYEKVFIQEIEYCSDSSGRWAYGPPDERIAPKTGLPFHFLTHPISWGDDDLLPAQRVHRWILNRAQSDIRYELPEYENAAGVNA